MELPAEPHVMSADSGSLAGISGHDVNIIIRIGFNQFFVKEISPSPRADYRAVVELLLRSALIAAPMAHVIASTIALPTSPAVAVPTFAPASPSLLNA